MSSLFAMGHDVTVFEPDNGWSFRNLILEKGLVAYYDFRRLFPMHDPVIYSEKNFDPAEYLYDADLVIVHEWNNPEIVRKIGQYRQVNENMILLFHDTHHRSVTKPDEMSYYDLRNYDGVLAFGDVIRRIYLKNGWTKNAWTWHEAADDRLFHPVKSKDKEGDLVWIGNWGDDERTEELQEFIIEPVKELGLDATFYGVMYPSKALKILKSAKIRYKGWLANYRVPEVFGKYSVTVHVPRRPYVRSLPGIPTIRPFEAMACGIPLICSPWNDAEQLFTPGKDFLVAENGIEMKQLLRNVLDDQKLSASITDHALNTIRNRHTCDHRVEELMKIVNSISVKRREPVNAAS
jgi:spore maturation protein CgeB